MITRALITNGSLKKLGLLTILSFVYLFTLQVVGTPTVHAAYNGGNIIDNATFLDAQSMNSNQIQSFLASKGGGIANASFLMNCDAAGSKAKQAYLSLGAPCGQTVAASRIIYYSAQVYGLSPRVILTTLQKEQSLITSPNPTARQYSQAMGYACPTSGNCSDSSNFFWQIDNGTWVLRFHYERAQGNNSWWYTSSSWVCGTAKNYYKPSLYPGQNVNFYDEDGVLYRTHYVANAATSAMYCYTPHAFNNHRSGVPSQGVATGTLCYSVHPEYGSVGRCYTGSYNFFKYFNLWFNMSSTIFDNVIISKITQPDTTPARGQTVSYTFSFTNTLSSAITVDSIGIIGRVGSLTGTNRDYGWTGPITLQPGATQQFTFTTLVRDTGQLYMWPAILYNGTYVQYNNWGASLVAHKPNISLVAPLSSTSQNMVAGQSTTLSATVKNNEDQPISVSALGIPVRYYDRYNYDTAWATITPPLQPGETKLLSGTVTFDKPGPYKAWVSGLIAGQYTTLSQNLEFNVRKPSPSFILTYTETPNATPAFGEDVTIKFKLKNTLGVPITVSSVGIIGRYGSPSSTTNSDFGWSPTQTFAAGEEKSFTTFSTNINQLKDLYAWIGVLYEGSYTQYNAWGFRMIPHLPNISVSAPLTVNSGSKPPLGQRVPVSVTLKNNEPRAIKYSALGIAARYYGAYNYDPVWLSSNSLPAGGSISVNGSMIFDKHGPYTLWPSILINGRYMTIGNTLSLNL